MKYRLLTVRNALHWTRCTEVYTQSLLSNNFIFSQNTLMILYATEFASQTSTLFVPLKWVFISFVRHLSFSASICHSNIYFRFKRKIPKMFLKSDPVLSLLKLSEILWLGLEKKQDAEMTNKLVTYTL